MDPINIVNGTSNVLVMLLECLLEESPPNDGDPVTSACAQCDTRYLKLWLHVKFLQAALLNCLQFLRFTDALVAHVTTSLSSYTVTI